MDDYQPDGFLTQYAGQILYTQCMKKKNFTESAPDNVAKTMPPNVNRMARKLFNVALAKSYGYHSGPPVIQVSNRDKPSIIGAELVADQSCSKEANQRLASGSGQASSIQGYAGQAYDASKVDSLVLADLPKWRSCMLSLGLPDIPNTVEGVFGMPTHTQSKEFGFNYDSNDPGKPISFVASGVAEINAAVHDAQCRESSHLSADMYASEVQTQEIIIGQHRVDFDHALAATQAENAAASAVVKSYGG